MTNKAVINNNNTHSQMARMFSVLTALALITLLLPISAINACLALVKRQAPLKRIQKVDIANRHYHLLRWQCGVFKSSSVLVDIVFGQVYFFGTPLVREPLVVMPEQAISSPFDKAGIFDILQLHQLTGLSTLDSTHALLKQQAGQSGIRNCVMAVKICLAKLIYQRGGTVESTAELFGIGFKNVSMAQAVDWVLDSSQGTCSSAYFINVNSINLAASNQAFYHTLTQSDANFLDGSGMRLAAQKAGINLEANVNGTDMLLPLCQQALIKGKSLFLLGAKPGVAKKAAANICKDVPGLEIRGTQDGYFDDVDAVIAAINASGADILLVALGSPYQEQWIEQHREKLNCSCAMAVGGLFDFFSGDMPRAPLWLREIGMEWVWRLMQEPKAKFNRYVIGNPIFMYRVHVLKQATRRLHK